MQIFNAIKYKSKKRMGALAVMLLFVMVSLYLMFSLMFTKDIIVNRITAQKLPHTRIFYTMSKRNQMYRDMFASEGIKTFLNDTPELGVTTRSSKVLSFKRMDTEVVDSEDHMRVIEGKTLSALEANEVAILRQDAASYKEGALGQTITLYPEKIEVVVASVVDYPYLDMVYNPIQAFKGIELFEETTTPKMFITNTLYESVFETRKLAYAKDRFENDVEYNAWDFEMFVYGQLEIPFDINDPYQRTSYQTWLEQDFEEQFALKLYYETFRYETEEIITNKLSMLGRTGVDGKVFSDNIYQIDSMALLTRSNPLPKMLQGTLSQFVVSGIVVSSLYAFYIHLQNQLNANRKTIATFNIIGIEFKRIWRAYMKLFSTFVLGALFLFGLTVLGLHMMTRDFQITVPALLATLGCSAGFYLLVLGIFRFQLQRLTKRSHDTVKTGGITYVKTPKFTQSRLVLVLSMKRLTSKMSLMLGFALSIALSLTVLLISVSSLTTISNIYDQRTLGINFDYLVPQPTFEQFEYLESNADKVTQVSKEPSVIYVDYSFNNPVSNVTRGSVVTFYDTIEGFVDVYRGEFPPHADTFKGESIEEVYGVVHTLASKRMADLKGLNPKASGYGIKAESKFLFVKQNFLDYEEARGIFGMFSTLMDRGFTSYNYRKLRRSGQALGLYPVMNTLVRLESGASHEAFEALMKEKGIEYLTNDAIIREFSTLNASLNKQSIDMLWIVGGAMVIQTMINLSGVLVQLDEERRREDMLLGRLGMAKQTLNQVHRINVFARVILSMIGSLMGVLVLLPLLNQALKLTFAVTLLPKELLLPIVAVLSALSIGLMCILWLSSFYKPKEGKPC